jgi:hypothetical protein
VANAPLVLRSSDDTDGDGRSDAAEGPADADGDRIADFADDIANTNMLRLDPDGRILETLAGLGLRLGTLAFTQTGAYVALREREISTDVDFGYSSDVMDFEVTRLDPGAAAQIVMPLAHPVSEDAVFRTHAGGEWHDFAEAAGDAIRTAPGTGGACPPPASPAYRAGLVAAAGCIELRLTDGGPNDADGVVDGVIRLVGGLAEPVSAAGTSMPQQRTVLRGDGEALMARTRLHSDSGDALLRSLTLQADGAADETLVDHVLLVHDIDHDGEWDDDEVVLANDRYTVDDGELTLTLAQPLEMPVGDTDLLVVYVFGPVE